MTIAIGFVPAAFSRIEDLRRCVVLGRAEFFDRDTEKVLAGLEVEHRELLLAMDQRYHDFSDLDERFHRLVNDASHNRFIVDFYDVISLIFHYHYQWNKIDERQRNEAALLEHLDYIEALFSRDPSRIEDYLQEPSQVGSKTLLASIDAAPPAARSDLKAGGSREAAADSFLTGRDEKPKQRWL